ncbi:MAG: glycosyltransferase family 9 protein [Pirellulaceae bacterium]|nr:glycosyltransferase family 9 protein [Pirellulaceae bacterium]
MPMVCALRRRFPTSHITWAVEKASAPLVAACAAVDRVVTLPKGLLTSPAASWQARRELLPLQIDVAIDPQGLTKSATVGWLSGAPRRIGLAAPAGREISPWLNTELVVSRRAHMVERYLELLAPLGVESPAVEFGLRSDPKAVATIRAWQQRAELTTGYAVLNPGASWDSKRWPGERFAQVAAELGRYRGLPSVIAWGSQRERILAEEIVAASAGYALLAPPTTLLELTELLRGSRLTVSSDTGPLHLAAAVESPCVGIFGTTRRELCAPYGDGNIAVQRVYDGNPARKRPGSDNWAVRAVTVEDVCEACDQLLARTESTIPGRFVALPVGRN